MRFNTALRHLAADFRKKYLNSSDESDGVFLPPDWRDEKVYQASIPCTFT